MVNTRVNLSGLELDNPVIPASGTFGFGYEFAEFYDINVLGSISLKGTTKEPRFGNPTPRIAECTSGLINSVGLQNPGVHAVIEEELPKLEKCFHKPVMANVSGFSIEEYAYSAALLDLSTGERRETPIDGPVQNPKLGEGFVTFATGIQNPGLAALLPEDRIVFLTDRAERFEACGNFVVYQQNGQLFAAEPSTGVGFALTEADEGAKLLAAGDGLVFAQINDQYEILTLEYTYGEG